MTSLRTLHTAAAARRSAAPLVGLAVMLLGVAAALIAQEEGLHLWADLMSGLGSAGAYLHPALAGFMAFTSSRAAAPLRVRLSTSPRSAALTLWRHFGALLAPILTGYAAAIGLLVAYGAAIGVYGSPDWPWLFCQIAALTFSASCGYALGMLFAGRWWIAPASALLLFAGFLSITYTASAPEWLALWHPIDSDLHSVFISLTAGTLLSQGIAYLAAALALVAGAAATLTARRRKLELLSVAIPGTVFVALFSLIMLGGWTFATLPAANDLDLACEGERPEICLNPGYSAAAPELRAAFTEFNRKAAGTPLVADRLEHRLRGAPDDRREHTRSVYVDALQPGFAETAVFDYAQSYGGAAACDYSGDGFEVVEVVDSWLSGADLYGYSQLGDDFPAGAAYAWLTSREPEESIAWFEEHIDDYLTCSLTFEDMQ